MKYISLQSTDPFLLARMAVDIELHGKKRDLSWNVFDPFKVETWLIYYDWCGFQFHNHPGCGSPERIELTNGNYLTVLNKIINP